MVYELEGIHRSVLPATGTQLRRNTGTTTIPETSLFVGHANNLSRTTSVPIMHNVIKNSIPISNAQKSEHENEERIEF